MRSNSHAPSNLFCASLSLGSHSGQAAKVGEVVVVGKQGEIGVGVAKRDWATTQGEERWREAAVRWRSREWDGMWMLEEEGVE